MMAKTILTNKNVDLHMNYLKILYKRNKITITEATKQSKLSMPLIIKDGNLYTLQEILRRSKMYLKVTCEDEFDDLLMYLKANIKSIIWHGRYCEQTDMSKFSKKFFASNTTADASVDANANVDISVIAYHSELPAIFRLNIIICCGRIKKALRSWSS